VARQGSNNNKNAQAEATIPVLSFLIRGATFGPAFHTSPPLLFTEAAAVTTDTGLHTGFKGFPLLSTEMAFF